MNKVILKGRLTTAPELKRTSSDIAICNFSVAVNRRFDRDKADFINCTAWRQTAEFVAKYFGKGQEIALIGELHIDKSEKDGEARYYTSVNVDEVEFCGSKNENTKPASMPTVEPSAANFEVIEDDIELPFD